MPITISEMFQAAHKFEDNIPPHHRHKDCFSSAINPMA
jgi:hypothetical protein